MKNLIYTTIGYNIEWFDIILILIDSLIDYSYPNKFDFLVICDDNMYNHIKDYFNKNSIYNKLNIKIHNVKFNSQKPDIASINKLRIFDYENINDYEKILFLDGDIICTLNINEIFQKDLAENILYVYKEKININDHNHRYWGFENYTEKDLDEFKINNIYPFNCGIFLFKVSDEIKSDFSLILEKIKNHKGDYYYEQSFMNVYFNKKRNINYTLFTRDNYIMFPENILYKNHILHFCGCNNPALSKKQIMINYKEKYLLIKNFDDRNEMLVFYSNKLTNPILCEIGVFKGEFLDYIYNNCKCTSIDAIDLFDGNTCSGNADGNNVIHYNMSQSYIELKDKYKDTIVNICKSDSSTYLKSLDDNFYDIIYIDGDHSYSGVKKDLTEGFKKIKNNGYIMGHDYEMNMSKAKTHYDFGVKKAVDEFCDQYKQKIIAKGMDGCVSFCIRIVK